MANVFLNREPRDTETAIMLENAIVHDIGNAVAYTDGKQVFINTDDNLTRILPSYNHDMLKWLLWHERLHMELSHHSRFFKYLNELTERETKDKFNVSKQEVNIIMDILVHDTLSKWFPELVETAINNLAQMRNRNSLRYTFTTSTLEEMLDEYKHFKEDKDSKSDSEDGEGDDKGKDKSKGKSESKDKDTKEKPSDESSAKDDTTKGHGKSKEESGTDKPTSRAEDGEPTIDETATRPESGEHDKTDWSRLEEIDDDEFITENQSCAIKQQVEELKRKKFKLANLTKTLNGLVTSERIRTYAKPSPIKLAGGAVLKGSTPGKTQLYLCFDASGSMGGELSTFKEIITKSIPQAMNCPCEWFSGRNSKISPYKTEEGEGYYKGKFKDIMPVYASSGYSDDGDRTIELCYQAEQLGYSPIGVTDGGGQISWSRDKLKLLKRTVFVGQNKWWLDKVQSINPKVQILHI